MLAHRSRTGKDRRAENPPPIPDGRLQRNGTRTDTATPPARSTEQVIPPPGSAKDDERPIVDPTAQTADPMLAKVSRLLAHAESTSFDAEAEIFTAKANELLARHAIDAAVVWNQEEQVAEPTIIRLPVDDPYVQLKNLLLAAVAKESQCEPSSIRPTAWCRWSGSRAI